MTPEDFMQHWDISVAELAQLTGKSRETVYHWIGGSTAKSKRDAPIDVIRQLELIHAVWLLFDTLEDTLPSYIHCFYEQVKERRELKRRKAALSDADN